MTKLYRDSIEVSQDQDGGPQSFIWRHKVYQVASYTVEPQKYGYSFRPPPPKPRLYKVETKQGLVCELVKDPDGSWVLERVWD